MPHLHLPAAHSDADLALAADVAIILGSQDLYVTWTHAEGPGIVPKVEALLRDERPAHPFGALVVALAQGVASLWRAVIQGPAPRHLDAPAPASAPEPATGEPAA